ncbi:hypothetical protein GCM10027259_05230 [Micromonospora palomenae]
MEAPVERVCCATFHLTRMVQPRTGGRRRQRTGRSVMDRLSVHEPAAPCIPPVWFPARYRTFVATTLRTHRVTLRQR